MPKITIEFEHSEVRDAIEILMKMEDVAAGYSGDDVKPNLEGNAVEPLTDAEKTVLVTSSEPPKPRAGTAAALLADENKPKMATAQDLIDKAAADNRVEAKQVQTADKKRVSKGDEINTPLGDGVIEATYRGQAIVAFEDGSAAMVMSRDLTSIPDGDGGGPEEGGPEEEPQTNGAAMPKSQWVELRDLAGKFCSEHKAKPEEIVALLGEYGVSKFDALPALAFEPLRVGINALGGVEDAGANYGF